MSHNKFKRLLDFQVLNAKKVSKNTVSGPKN